MALDHDDKTAPPPAAGPADAEKRSLSEARLNTLGVVLAGAGAALLVFVLYLMTLAPTVLYYDDPGLLDAAMVQMQVAVLGITHPTGYPTYLMLSHLFTYLPFGDVAYRVNLASAAYAALSVIVVYAAGLIVSRRVIAAAVAALAFGLGGALWSQAVIAEVYTLNALLEALTILVLLLWRERQRGPEDSPKADRYLLLAALLTGLCLTNHLTSGLLLPGALLFVGLVEWRKLLDWRLMLKAAGLFFVGLLPYLYLPIRAWMGAPFLGNNPTNFERFSYIVSGGNLRGTFFAFGLGDIPGRLAFYGGYLLDNFHLIFVMFALTGAVVMLVKDRAGAAFLGFLFFGWLVHALGNDIPDINLYFIPTYLVLCLWASVGISAILETVDSLLSGTRRVVGVAVLAAAYGALLLLPLAGVGEKYERNDMSDALLGRERIEAVADSAEPNSTVLQHRSELWYLVLVEKRRQDITIVDPFWHNREIGYADIVWPDDLDLAASDKRYGTEDFSGVTSAEKAARRGPVYIIDQEGINPSGLYEAGWRTIKVDGALFKLVPPSPESSTD